MGQNPEGVVTATGVMVSPGWDGWVGVMYWFMMISTSGSCQVGQLVPHTSNTVESADSFTAGDTVGGGPNRAVAVTTSTATPIGTVVLVAVRRRLPTRRAIRFDRLCCRGW